MHTGIWACGSIQKTRPGSSDCYNPEERASFIENWELLCHKIVSEKLDTKIETPWQWENNAVWELKWEQD